jgi:lipoprotein-releasing system ATP-binding protein
MKSIITALDIKKTYPMAGGSVEVLKGLNISIAEGEMVAIKGESGVGKSTLLHILGVLDDADSGLIKIDGVKIDGMWDHQKAKIRNDKIGFIFQFYHLLNDFNVIENVLFPTMIGRVKKHRDGKELRKRARELLASVGLEQRMKHKPGELSGGEQQRVAIARALINDPRIILADEPTGNLDTATSESIHNLLKELSQGMKKTIVLVTHDDHLAEMCDRTVHMIDGVTDDR